MFSDILAQLKNPTTELIDRSKNEDTKMGAIKLAMISFVISALNIITSVLAIFNKYTEKNYSWYSKEKLAKLRSDALGELEIVKTFFQSWLMIAIAIVVIALILFIISKLVKSSQEYSTTLSMVNNVLIIYVIGSILTEIFSLIYGPLRMLVSIANFVFVATTLMCSFKDLLELESSDLLVFVTTGVTIASVVIVFIIFSSVTGVSLKDIDSIMSILK